MYKVICTFADSQDDNYIYNAGDEYPHAGYSPSGERIDELATSKNRLGKPLIRLAEKSAAVESEKAEAKDPIAKVSAEETPKRGRRSKKAE